MSLITLEYEGPSFLVTLARVPESGVLLPAIVLQIKTCSAPFSGESHCYLRCRFPIRGAKGKCDQPRRLVRGNPPDLGLNTIGAPLIITAADSSFDEDLRALAESAGPPLVHFLTKDFERNLKRTLYRNRFPNGHSYS